MFALQSKYPEDYLNNILKINRLCDTVGGNPCYILTITTDVKKNDINLDKARKGSAQKKERQNSAKGIDNNASHLQNNSNANNANASVSGQSKDQSA